MTKYFTFILFIVIWANFSFASNTIIYHNELEPVVKGENARLELNIVGLAISQNSNVKSRSWKNIIVENRPNPLLKRGGLACQML